MSHLFTIFRIGVAVTGHWAKGSGLMLAVFFAAFAAMPSYGSKLASCPTLLFMSSKDVLEMAIRNDPEKALTLLQHSSASSKWVGVIESQKAAAILQASQQWDVDVNELPEFARTMLLRYACYAGGCVLGYMGLAVSADPVSALATSATAGGMLLSGFGLHNYFAKNLEKMAVEEFGQVAFDSGPLDWQERFEAFTRNDLEYLTTRYDGLIIVSTGRNGKAIETLLQLGYEVKAIESADAANK